MVPLWFPNLGTDREATATPIERGVAPEGGVENFQRPGLETPLSGTQSFYSPIEPSPS